jgi:hypothetical protein
MPALHCGIVRDDEVGMLIDVVDQPLLITAHFEKIVGFLDRLRGRLVVRATAVDQFPLGVKAFAPEAIKAFVFAEIDVAGIVDTLQDRLYHCHMARVGGADEIIVGNVQLRPQFPEKAADLIHVLPRRPVLLLGGADDFVSMLVRAGEKIGLVTGHGVKPPDHIRCNGGVGMAQVGSCVHVVYGRGNVKRRDHGFISCR